MGSFALKQAPFGSVPFAYCKLSVLRMKLATF